MAISLSLGETLKALENERLATLSRIKVTVAVSIPLVGALATYFYFTHSPGAMVISVIGGAICTAGITVHLLRKIKKAYKQRIIPVLLRTLDSSLAYEEGSYVSTDEFAESNLFSSPDRYSGKDLVVGYVGDTKVRFSHVHAEEEYETTSTDSEGRSQSETHYRTIFKGLLFIADFNKHFSGKTLVKPFAVNFISKLFGSNVALEDPEFNKQFTVTFTDQVEARYILTPSLMERMKTLRSKVGAFRASFCSERLFMAIDMPSSAFEPAVLSSLADHHQAAKIHSNLRTVTGIVGDLGLNTRIWTKRANRPINRELSPQSS